MFVISKKTSLVDSFGYRYIVFKWFSIFPLDNHDFILELFLPNFKIEFVGKLVLLVNVIELLSW